MDVHIDFCYTVYMHICIYKLDFPEPFCVRMTRIHLVIGKLYSKIIEDPD